MQGHEPEVAWEGHVMIAMLTGRRFSVPTHGDRTVAWLKDQIEPISGVPPRSQRLVYGSAILDDSCTLRSCGVVAGSAMRMVGSGLEHQCRASGCVDCRPPLFSVSKLICAPCAVDSEDNGAEPEPERESNN
eukprot:TRINITY_DN33214_c0_g1_i1.p1 TRINITY_DN33214_c0_g1~~TRINITY_DN33214_c0_g1_i1.p1  ORF type:complete len:132 (-),score=9.19 TRINITY_DN33214_c0_g1_i1:414-809(-)